MPGRNRKQGKEPSLEVNRINRRGMRRANIDTRFIELLNERTGMTLTWQDFVARDSERKNERDSRKASVEASVKTSVEILRLGRKRRHPTQ